MGDDRLNYVVGDLIECMFSVEEIKQYGYPQEIMDVKMYNVLDKIYNHLVYIRDNTDIELQNRTLQQIQKRVNEK